MHWCPGEAGACTQAMCCFRLRRPPSTLLHWPHRTHSATEDKPPVRAGRQAGRQVGRQAGSRHEAGQVGQAATRFTDITPTLTPTRPSTSHLSIYSHTIPPHTQHTLSSYCLALPSFPSVCLRACPPSSWHVRVVCGMWCVVCGVVYAGVALLSLMWKGRGGVKRRWWR